MEGTLSESEIFLETWTLVMGAAFVLIVLFLPNGLAGLVSLIGDRVLRSVGRGSLSQAKSTSDGEAGAALLRRKETVQQP